MPQKILVVDDEREIADLVELYLKNEGFAVRKFYNAADALACVRTEELDLAILDVMLPDMDGFTLCARIREEHFWPIIMLTARVEDIDKIMGLTIGADDYITKPFNPLELVARVKTQLRRYTRYNHPGEEAPASENEYDIRGLVINKDSETYLKVKLDTENYRERRKETLENLAKNIAVKVKRTRKPVTLEPMNPYERRIIHSALQSDKYVETHSEGEEPFRKVVVTPKNQNNSNVNVNKYGKYSSNYKKNSSGYKKDYYKYSDKSYRRKNYSEKADYETQNTIDAKDSE